MMYCLEADKPHPDFEAPDAKSLELDDWYTEAARRMLKAIEPRDSFTLTKDDMEHRLNIDDLRDEIDDLYMDGEGRLTQRTLEKLVDYIIRELTLPLCPKCERQFYPSNPKMHETCGV